MLTFLQHKAVDARGRLVLTIYNNNIPEIHYNEDYVRLPSGY